MLGKFNQKLTNVVIFLALVGALDLQPVPAVLYVHELRQTRTDYYVDPFRFWGLNLTWENYLTMISQFKIFNLFKNSFIISFYFDHPAIGLGIVASYAFAKLKFKGKEVIYLAGACHHVHPGPGDDHPPVHALLQDRPG